MLRLKTTLFSGEALNVHEAAGFVVHSVVLSAMQHSVVDCFKFPETTDLKLYSEACTPQTCTCVYHHA